MSARLELTTHLAPWAAEHRLHLRWVGELLRIEDHDGRARAVVVFAPGYWSAFEAASAERRGSAMMAMISDVQLQWSATWAGSDAMEIKIPLSYVLER
jgi:hypothetical protein